jgi:glycosyltransferase involved in cell wall biosynthesis
MNPPKVSVIVPSYNKPEYLPECLRSVQAQTFTDWECIVVNDGSPRGEEIRAAVAAMDDRRFRLAVHQNNRGPGAARNTGVREARGSLLICIDEDDWIAHDCLEKLRLVILNENAAVVCPYGIKSGVVRDVFSCRLRSLRESLTGVRLLGAGFLFRKEIWDLLGGWDEDPRLQGREDFDWWLRAMAAGVRVVVIPESLYFIRPRITPIDEIKSLNIQSRFREIYIRKIIVRKHERLYGQYPKEKRLFLAEGYEHEAECNYRVGRKWLSMYLFWLAFGLSPSGSRLEKALKATIGEALGGNVIRAINRTRGCSMGKCVCW